MRCSAHYTLVVVSDGASVKGITAYYALSNTTTAPSVDSFTAEIKTPSATERYLWCFEQTTYSDGSDPTRTEPIIIGTYVTDGKDAPKVLVQYQYSASDRTPPTKLTLYKVNGYLVSFVDGVLGDDEGSDWSTDPSTITSTDDAETWETDPTALTRDTSKPYLWMRVSTDGGKTWQYSVVTGPKASFFELLSSKDTFRQNARGAVDEADTITFWVVRHDIDESEICTWSISPDTLTIDADSVHADSIEITIPVGFTPVSFTVSLQVGQISETLSKTINAMTVGSVVARKLKTIDRSAIPYEDFPTTLDDGVSPVKDGDYLLVRLADEKGNTYLVPYRYSETVDTSTGLAIGWVPSSGAYGNHSEIMGNCLQEVLANSQTTPSTSALYAFFQNMVANDAFIRFLCAQYLEIQGAIYGGGFDRYGSNENNEDGFYLDKNGAATMVGLIARSAILSGSFSCPTFRTVSGKDITSLTLVASPNLINGYELNKTIAYITVHEHDWPNTIQKDCNIKVGATTYTKLRGETAIRTLTATYIIEKESSSSLKTAIRYITDDDFFENCIFYDKSLYPYFPASSISSCIVNGEEIDITPVYLKISIHSQYSQIPLDKTSFIGTVEATVFKSNSTTSYIINATETERYYIYRKYETLYIENNNDSLVFSGEIFTSLSINISMQATPGIESMNVVPMDGDYNVGLATRRFATGYFNTINSSEIFSDNLTLESLPTSESGLAEGQVWNDNGTLKIKQ